MNTIIADANEKNTYEKASEILKNSGLVAFPTETVYGLGADALDADAAAKIYAAKGRPSDNPLIVHIADKNDVYKLAANVPEKALMLMEAFWPGPLTIILPKKDIVPDGTTGGLRTVAIRMPSHPVAMKLIKDSGVYIAAPSANTSGRPSPTKASHVIEDMNGKIDMIIDGGEVGIGIESTIVDLTGDIPAILRPGYVTKSMLENIIGEVIIDPAIIHPDPKLRPKAPGMKYTHYAPHGSLTIVEAGELTTDGLVDVNNNPTDNELVDVNSNQTDNELVDANGNPTDNELVDANGNPTDNELVDANGNQTADGLVAAKINQLVAEKEASNITVAVIATEETKHLYNCKHILTVGSEGQGDTVAARLYAVLRDCDTLGAEYIYSEAFNYGELGNAIMNRLLKAAGQKVITVYAKL